MKKKTFFHHHTIKSTQNILIYKKISTKNVTIPFLVSVGGVGGDSWVIGAIDWTSLSLVGNTSSPSQLGGTWQLTNLGHTSLDVEPKK